MKSSFAFSSLSFFVLALGGVARGELNCSSIFVPVQVQVEAPLINLTVPVNQSEVTNLIQQFLTVTSNVAGKSIVGTQNISARYEIFGKLCTPHGVLPNGTLEIATHGVGFSNFYWDLGGDDSPNNYAASAVAAGHSIFYYDRLGTGNSSKPDGIQEVQLGVEVEVAHGVVEYFKDGNAGISFGRIIGVGHSVGSLVTLGVTQTHPTDFEDVVLTGLAINNTLAVLLSVSSIGSQIAAQEFPERFGDLPNSYLALEGLSNLQVIMVQFPFFNQSLIEFSFQNTATFTIGELVSLLLVENVKADKFTGRVLVLTGASDLPFCGGDCSQTVGDTSVTLVEAVQIFYPAASNFTTFVPANTGHAINLQDSAPKSYAFIENWIGSANDDTVIGVSLVV
ncbi:hypothetical protein SISNIDRAFT_499160 [Sistotremastrum niveocremeum HHB9708]|uniref:AB hydrolase-1 domain-containing protein n=1 Tax=Sistotremastrum niveocremeum HHB9708 TaxID=1314777 RepID=A0A165ADA0_9AGAM|nr:hypothetical protein SISNIDRAFT_499160 [Sistotremastrum niveocremeum HHB9708]